MKLISGYAKSVVFVTSNKNDILELAATSEAVSWLPLFFYL